MLYHIVCPLSTYTLQMSGRGAPNTRGRQRTRNSTAQGQHNTRSKGRGKRTADPAPTMVDLGPEDEPPSQKQRQSGDSAAGTLASGISPLSAFVDTSEGPRQAAQPPSAGCSPSASGSSPLPTGQPPQTTPQLASLTTLEDSLTASIAGAMKHQIRQVVREELASLVAKPAAIPEPEPVLDTTWARPAGQLPISAIGAHPLQVPATREQSAGLNLSDLLAGSRLGRDQASTSRENHRLPAAATTDQTAGLNLINLLAGSRLGRDQASTSQVASTSTRQATTAANGAAPASAVGASLGEAHAALATNRSKFAVGELHCKPRQVRQLNLFKLKQLVPITFVELT